MNSIGWPLKFKPRSPGGSCSKCIVYSQEKKTVECGNHYNVIFIKLHTTTDGFVNVQPLYWASEEWTFLHSLFSLRQDRQTSPYPYAHQLLYGSLSWPIHCVFDAAVKGSKFTLFGQLGVS